MAPITWQNINAPDFRASMLGMQQASGNLNMAGEQLKQLIQNQGNINNENWDNQARLNTDAVIAERENAGNLGQFVSQDPNYDLGSLRERFGAQIDPTRVNEGAAAVKARLMDVAMNQAMTAGNQVADGTRSPAQAAEAVRQNLLAQGATPDIAQAGGLKYLQEGLGMQKAAWEERTNKVSNELLTGLDFSGGDPVALKQQAREMIGDPNFDYSLIDKGIDAGVNQTNDVVDRRDMLEKRNQDKTDISLRRDIMNEVFKADPNTTDPMTLARNLATQSGMSQRGWMNLEAELTKGMEIRPDQEAALTVYGSQATQKLNEYRSALETEKAKIATPTDPMQKAPYDSKFAETAVAMGIKEPGGIIGAIGKLAKENAWFSGLDFSNDVKDGLLATVKQIEKDGIPTDAANVLALKAFNDIGGTRASGLTGKDGVDITAHRERTLALAKQYKEHEKFQQEIAPKVKAIDEDILKATAQTKSLIEQAMLGTMRSNLRGTTYNLPPIK